LDYKAVGLEELKALGKKEWPDKDSVDRGSWPAEL
jgi:hypothetical protein